MDEETDELSAITVTVLVAAEVATEERPAADEETEEADDADDEELPPPEIAGIVTVPFCTLDELDDGTA